jgi:O-antigen/teichoic acid export membrane protein
MTDVARSSPPSAETDARSKSDLTRTVVRNSTFVLGMQMLLKALALLFNVYVIRRLGDVHFGQYSAVMAFVAIFGIFTDWGMSFYSLREMAEDHTRTAWVLPNVVAIRLVLSLPIVVIAPLTAYWLGKGFDMVLGVLIAGAGLLVYAFQGPLDSALTARERLDYISTFSLIKELVFWGLGVLLLLSGIGFVGLIVASLTGVVVVALLATWVLFRKLGVGRLVLSVRRWPQLLLGSLPFGISGIAYVFMQNFDIALMSFVLSDAAVGWYNAPYTLINMMLLIAQSIAIAMFPSMVRGYKATPHLLSDLVRQSIRYLLIICLPIAVGGTILADQIIITLYTEEFVNSISVLRLILWALPSLFLLELLGRLAFTLHLERQTARIDVINAIITVLLNVLLIPSLGVLGAALALVIGRAVRLLQLWHLIGNDRLVGRQWLPLLRVVLAAGLMGGAVVLLRGLPLIPSIGIGVGLYGALVLGLRAVDVRELRYLGKILVRRRARGMWG